MHWGGPEVVDRKEFREGARIPEPTPLLDGTVVGENVNAVVRSGERARKLDQTQPRRTGARPRGSTKSLRETCQKLSLNQRTDGGRVNVGRLLVF